MKQTDSFKIYSNRFKKEYDLATAQKIGEGNFAEVYKLYDSDLKKYFAIRKLKKTQNDMQDIQKQKSINEQLKNLSNPYILQIYDIIQFQKQMLYITQYCDGGSLWYYYIIRDALNQVQGGKFSEKDSVQTIIKIAKGVQILHQHKITHRDLKPENVLLTKKYKRGREIPDIKIADFGLSTNKLIMQTVAGTKQYLSPQQAKFHSYTNSVDVWAIGIIFDQLLHGSPFYTGQDNKQVFNKISTVLYEVRDKKLIKQIQDLLNLMLKKRAYQRPIISHIILRLQEIQKILASNNKNKNKDTEKQNKNDHISNNNIKSFEFSQEEFSPIKIKKGLITSAWDIKITKKQSQPTQIKNKIRKPQPLKMPGVLIFHLEPIQIKFVEPKIDLQRAKKLNYLTNSYKDIQQWIVQSRKKNLQQAQNILGLIKSQFYFQLDQAIQKYINSIFE